MTPPIDPKQIRVGDRVTIDAEVTAIWPHCRLPVILSAPSYAPLSVDYKDLATHTPKALSPGDRVRWKVTTVEGTDCVEGKILAVDGDEAWIKPDLASPRETRPTVNLSHLERIP